MKRLCLGLARSFGAALYKVFIAVLVVGFIGGITALANYAVTQGAGTNFGSIVIGGVTHYAQMLMCDPATPAQCVNVSAGGSGHVLDDNSAALLASVQAPLAAGTNQIGTVTNTPTLGKGCTPFHGPNGGTAASNNATNIKNAPAILCRFTTVSTSGTLAYLKVYDLAAVPNCALNTGLKHVYPVPASATGAGVQVFDTFGENYAVGLGFCVVGGPTDTDNTNAPTGVFIEGSFF